ncbi:MAG: hypothetical protein JNL19_00545 [Burkholderiales bacterium]|nr:hypothetical protein [Burkholderiales bacterium]
MADLPNASATLGQSATQFLHWWKQHLWECVPAGLRNALTQSQRPAMWSGANDHVWARGAAITDNKPYLQSSLAQSGGPVALVVGESNGFRRSVVLPLNVEPQLQQVLGYEVDRLTPLRANDVYYDIRVRQRDTQAGTLTAELVAVPKSRVAPMLELATKRNLTVDRVVLAPEDIDTGLNLLASSRRVDEATGPRYGWVNPALMALCAGLALAVVAWPLWEMRQEIIALQPVEATAKRDAETASVLQRQLERQIGEYNLPLARKHGAPLVVQLLDDLSKRLPEDTWAQTLEVKPVPNQKSKEVIIQGETGSGGKILQLVQESPLIKDPTFKATMTRVAPTAERFHIAGELIVADLPKPLQLSDAAAVTTVQVAPAPAAGAPAAPKAPATTGAPTTATANPNPTGSAPPVAGATPPGSASMTPPTSGHTPPPAVQPPGDARKPAPAPTATPIPNSGGGVSTPPSVTPATTSLPEKKP